MGGVDGLVGYGHGHEPEDIDHVNPEPSDEADDASDDDNDDEAGHATDADISKGTDKELNQKLVKIYSAASHFYSEAPAAKVIDLKTTIPLTSDGLGLVLIRKSNAGYEILGSSTDEAYVKPVAMQNYLQDYTALPNSIRVLAETITTQCLPKNLQRNYNALADAAVKGTAPAGKKAVRSLMYMHQTGQFVLSPIRAKSGVVTYAKPKHAVLENAYCDTFVPTRTLRSLESKLIAGRNFNLFTASKAALIPRYSRSSGLASHALSLKNRFSQGENLSLEFWPYYEGKVKDRDQLITGELKFDKGIWRGVLAHSWFKKFSIDFISLWLSSHGEHIKRSHQQVFKLTFDKASLGVDFFYHDGVFESNVGVDIDEKCVNGTTTSVHVLTKDFAVVMRGLSDIAITSEVTLEVDADGIAFQFETASANYTVYVPTCDIEGTRSTKHFKQYVPVTLQPDDEDAYEDQSEGEFEGELA
jgi:hypothetical protein